MHATILTSWRLSPAVSFTRLPAGADRRALKVSPAKRRSIARRAYFSEAEDGLYKTQRGDFTLPTT